MLWDIQGLKNFGEVKQLLDSCSDKNGLKQGKKELENKLKINNMAHKFHNKTGWISQR